MTIPASIHVPAIEPFVIWGSAFSKDECDKIIAHGELTAFTQARTGSGDQSKLDNVIRRTDIGWIEPSAETHFLFQRIDQLCAKINFDKFQLDLTRFDGFQYGKYKPGGHYRWHIDTMNAPEDGLFRKLSFVLMLSDPEAYEGGDLLMAPDANFDNPAHLRPHKGDLVAFYSHVPHKVEPVTSGERYTLVTWVKGPKPR